MAAVWRMNSAPAGAETKGMFSQSSRLLAAGVQSQQVLAAGC